MITVRLFIELGRACVGLLRPFLDPQRAPDRGRGRSPSSSSGRHRARPGPPRHAARPSPLPGPGVPDAATAQRRPGPPRRGGPAAALAAARAGPVCRRLATAAPFIAPSLAGVCSSCSSRS